MQAFKDFLKGKDELIYHIENHDVFIDHLLSSTETIKLTIRQNGFKEKVNEYLQQFHEKYPDLAIPNSDGSFSRIMLRHVLFNYNLKEKLLGDIQGKFWKEYGKELLKFRNIEAFKPEIELMENALEEITFENDFIIEELKGIYNQYISKHHLPLEEIEKKHKFKFMEEFFMLL